MSEEESASNQVMDITEAPREALLEIVQSLQGRVQELEQHIQDISGPKANYVEFDLKGFGSFKMNSPTHDNTQLLSNLLSFIRGYRKEGKTHAPDTAKLNDQMV